MKWASAIGLGSQFETAAAETLERLTTESGLTQPDLVIAFVSVAYGAAMERLPRVLEPWLGDGLLFGCNAGGLIGGGDEEEDEPGIALLAGGWLCCAARLLCLFCFTQGGLNRSRKTRIKRSLNFR